MNCIIKCVCFKTLTIEKLADLFFEDCENPEKGLRRGQFAKLYTKHREACDEYFGEPLGFADFSKGDEDGDRHLSKEEFTHWLHAQDKNRAGIVTHSSE